MADMNVGQRDAVPAPRPVPRSTPVNATPLDTALTALQLPRGPAPTPQQAFGDLHPQSGTAISFALPVNAVMSDVQTLQRVLEELTALTREGGFSAALFRKAMALVRDHKKLIQRDSGTEESSLILGGLRQVKEKFAAVLEVAALHRHLLDASTLPLDEWKDVFHGLGVVVIARSERLIFTDAESLPAIQDNLRQITLALIGRIDAASMSNASPAAVIAAVNWLRRSVAHQILGKECAEARQLYCALVATVPSWDSANVNPKDVGKGALLLDAARAYVGITRDGDLGETLAAAFHHISSHQFTVKLLGAHGQHMDTGPSEVRAQSLVNIMHALRGSRSGGFIADVPSLISKKTSHRPNSGSQRPGTARDDSAAKIRARPSPRPTLTTTTTTTTTTTASATGTATTLTSTNPGKFTTTTDAVEPGAGSAMARLALGHELAVTSAPEGVDEPAHANDAHHADGDPSQQDMPLRDERWIQSVCTATPDTILQIVDREGDPACLLARRPEHQPCVLHRLILDSRHKLLDKLLRHPPVLHYLKSDGRQAWQAVLQLLAPLIKSALTNETLAQLEQLQANFDDNDPLYAALDAVLAAARKHQQAAVAPRDPSPKKAQPSPSWANDSGDGEQGSSLHPDQRIEALAQLNLRQPDQLTKFLDGLQMLPSSADLQRKSINIPLLKPLKNGRRYIALRDRLSEPGGLTSREARLRLLQDIQTHGARVVNARYFTDEELSAEKQPRLVAREKTAQVPFSDRVRNNLPSRFNLSLGLMGVSFALWWSYARLEDRPRMQRFMQQRYESNSAMRKVLVRHIAHNLDPIEQGQASGLASTTAHAFLSEVSTFWTNYLDQVGRWDEIQEASGIQGTNNWVHDQRADTLKVLGLCAVLMLVVWFIDHLRTRRS